MNANLKATYAKYVSLNILGMVGLSCYILADTFFIAKALGTTGLAALNFSISIYSAMHGLGLMLGIGGATHFSISKKDGTSFSHTVFLGAVFAFLLVLTGLFFTTPLSRMLGADDVTLPLTRIYLSTILVFSPCFIFNNILLAFVRNDENPRLSTIAMLCSSISNILLDYIFLFPLSLGMFGAAFATGISALLSLFVLSLHFFKKKQHFHLVRCRLHFKTFLRLCSYGFSSFIGELASSVSLIVFNLIIFHLEGNIGVAAYGIIANVALIVSSIFNGISQGQQPLASTNYSRGDTGSLQKVLTFSLSTAALFSIVTYAFLSCFAAPVIQVFNSESDLHLFQLAKRGISLYFTGYFFASINIVSIAFFSAISRPKYALLLSLLRSCILLIPAAFLCSALFQMDGVWISDRKSVV